MILNILQIWVLPAYGKRLEEGFLDTTAERFCLQQIENIQISLKVIRKKINSLSSQKDEMRSQIDLNLHKNYLVSCIFLAEKFLKKAEHKIEVSNRYLEEGFLEKSKIQYLKSKKYIEASELSIDMTRKIADFQNRVSALKENPQSCFIQQSEFQKGDMIFSYKTNHYLKKHILSKLIAVACASNITHSSFYVEDGKILTSGAEDVRPNGLGLVSSVPVPGEIFIVCRPVNVDTESINISIDEWHERALMRNQKIIGEKDIFYFSELKCWMACIIGLVYSSTVRCFKRQVVVPNLLKNNKGVFCSELVDKIYKDNNILLIPRGIHDAIIGPAELIYSPYFEFKGITGALEDIHRLKEEGIIV